MDFAGIDIRIFLVFINLDIFAQRDFKEIGRDIIGIWFEFGFKVIFWLWLDITAIYRG